MLCSTPKITSIALNLKLVKWTHLFLKRLVRSLKNVCTYLHCHMTCSIVSEFELQNVQSSHWFGLNFDTDLFVVRIWWMILNCNHNSLRSSVIFFRCLKKKGHGCILYSLFSHLLMPFGFSGLFKILWYMQDEPLLFARSACIGGLFSVLTELVKTPRKFLYLPIALMRPW